MEATGTLMDTLHALMRMKTHREQKAGRVVADDRRALAEADGRVGTASAALDDYRDWSATHERERYAAVCRRVVRPRELEWLREDIAALKVREGELVQLHHKAEEGAAAARGQLASSREVHRAASRACEKFANLLEADGEAARRESERVEDLETEDLRYVPSSAMSVESAADTEAAA